MGSSGVTERDTSRFAQAGKLRVHYNEAGTGEPLIFCEGSGAGTSAWVVYHRVLVPLARHFRCLLLDQPGYGKSDVITVKGESRSTMYARVVRDFMDALQIEKATIVDMSFGAQTAQVFALENPGRVNKLVLHASGLAGPTLFGHFPPEGFRAMGEAFANPSLAAMRGMMNAFLFNGTSYSDEELMLQERLDAWLARPEQDAARRASENIQRDLLAEIGKITVPVLQMHGRNDLIAPLEGALRLFNHLPDTRIVIFNRCGHWIPVERPVEFSNQITAFLSGATGL